MFDYYEMILVGIGEEFENNERASEAYSKLSQILSGKNYFVVSLCMDDKIYESEINAERIVTPLGGRRYKQCEQACTNDLYDVSDEKCPKCGGKLVFNNILAENYVEEGYLPQWAKHKKWLTGTLNRKLLVLELGTSMRFPEIIRFPFEKIVFLNEKSHLLRVNGKLPQVGHEVAARSESVKENSVDWLIEL